jgi:hypothetical protein
MIEISTILFGIVVTIALIGISLGISLMLGLLFKKENA